MSTARLICEEVQYGSENKMDRNQTRENRIHLSYLVGTSMYMFYASSFHGSELKLLSGYGREMLVLL